MSIFTLVKKQALLLMAGGLLSTAANAQWTQSTGIGGTIYSLISNDTIVWAGTDTGGVYRSTNNGSSFTAINNGIGNKTIKAISRRGGRLVAASADLGGAFRVSDDNGDNWTSPMSNYFGFVFTTVVDAGVIYAGTWYGVSKSTNGGNSWTTLGQTGLPSNSTVSSLVIAGSVGNVIFAGVASSGGGGTGVYRSDNAGTSWTAKNTGLTNTTITALAMVNGKLYAGTATGVFESSNNGDNWSPINNGMTSSGILTLQNLGGQLVAGTSLGVFKWYNGMWYNISGNLPSNSQVYSVALHAGNMLIGTNNGVWVGSANVLANEKLTSAELNVYPNPSTGIFNLSFDANSNTQVKVTNVMGQELMLNNYPQLSSAVIDLSALPKGIYFLTLNNGTAEVQRKIVIE